MTRQRGAEEPRVVSLIASGTEIVAALGMGRHLVGRSHSCDYPNWVERLPVLTRPRVNPDAPSREIDAAVRRLVLAGQSAYEIDSKRLARLRPDVIVTQDHCEVCAVSLRDVEQAVSCAGLPRVELCTLLPRDMADVRLDFLRVAGALGVPERGEVLLGRFDDRLQQLRDRTRGFPVCRLVMIEWLDPPMVAGGWMPELARIAGAEPLLITEGESRVVAWPEIAAAEPDHVVIMPCGFQPQRTLSDLESPTVRDGLKMITSVREGRCAILDGEGYLNRPGPRLAESAELLAAALRPRSFPDLVGAYAPAIEDGWRPR